MNPLITDIKQLLARYETTEPDDIAEIGTLEEKTEIRWIEGEVTPLRMGRWQHDNSVRKRFVGPNNSVVDENGNKIYATINHSYRVRVISRPKPAPKPTALEQLPEGVREAIESAWRGDMPLEALAQTILDNRAAIFAAGEPVGNLDVLDTDGEHFIVQSSIDESEDVFIRSQSHGSDLKADRALIVARRITALALQANKGSNQ